MASILDFFAAPIDKIVDSIGDAIDKNVTSDEERETLRNALVKSQLEARNEADKRALEYEKELTLRHSTDMQSDDIVSKRIRPLSVAYLLVVVSILALTDGNIEVGSYVFQIKAVYINLFQSLLEIGFMFYFGSRGLEKITKIIRNK